MVSSPTGAWLGAGRATAASMCAAASVAHQLGQADEPKAANSLEKGQENPKREEELLQHHHTPKCKYSATRPPIT